VWAFGKLSVLVSTWWIVKRRGPCEPVEPANIHHHYSNANSHCRYRHYTVKWYKVMSERMMLLKAVICLKQWHYPAMTWSLAAGLVSCLWQTAAAGLFVPRRTHQWRARTSVQHLSPLSNALIACSASSRRHQSCQAHQSSATQRHHKRYETRLQRNMQLFRRPIIHWSAKKNNLSLCSYLPLSTYIYFASGRGAQYCDECHC